MKQKFTSILVLFALILAFGAWGITSVQAAGRCYVNDDAGGANNGTSWTDAYTSLQSAFADSCTEIWVAAGVYKPTTSTDRNATFQLENGVSVYGGFAGTETLLSQRDPAVNVTILSGDIDNNDSQTPIITDINAVTGNNTNSYTVVRGATGATLDGFTITAGYNDGGSCSTGCGGGLLNSYSNPTIKNISFRGNWAWSAGAMSNNYSSPTLTNVTFSGNKSGWHGGAIYNWASNPTLTNVTFVNNSTAYYGGGIIENGNSNSILTNVTFSGNSAGDGGGIYNMSGSPTLKNVIVANSTSGGDCTGNALNAASSNNLIQSNISTCGLTNGVNGNKIGVNPLLGTLGNYGGFTQTIPLLAGSPAIDAGNTGSCTTGSDQRGVIYVGTCDIGAYEVINMYYVKPTASGTRTCDSWNNACTLQTALYLAGNGAEIWVTAGTHKPTAGTDRTVSLQLVSGVAVYGGFAGTETARDQRNPTANITILSGDIGMAGDNSDNSYHVVTGVTGATLDGFTITAGNANGSSPNDSGGGMYNNSGSPAIVNITFSANAASTGGGMYNGNGSNPTLTNVTFSGNQAQWGGGMGNTNVTSALTITNVTFDNNTASVSGGGLNNDHSSPTLTNVTFSNNTATTANGGGISNYDSSSPTLINVTFVNNSAAGWGGGLDNNTNCNAILKNVTFRENNAGTGGGLYNLSSNPQISNTILWDNLPTQITNENSTPTVAYSIVQGGYADGSNIITANPLLGTLGGYGGVTQTIPLLPGSPAIDAGNDAACPATDQRGVARPKGSHCDIGAVEMDPATFHTISGRVTASGVGMAGVTVTYGSGSTTTDANGNYSFAVHDVWTGTVTPSKAGYAFVPASKSYTNATINQLNQNYTAVSGTYTISGSAGVSGATITYTGGSTTADGTGNYLFTIAYGWSGTVTPSKTGYTFMPASRSYTNIASNQTSQNYSPVIHTYTISGNTGVGFATITYTGGSIIADATGNYSFTVTYGWSGTVTPARSGYTFAPASRDYTNIASDQAGQNYDAEHDTACADVPSITPGTDQAGYLSSADDIDPYKFEVADPYITIDIILTPPTIDSELELELHKTCDGLWGLNETIDIGHTVDIGGGDQNVYAKYNIGLETGTYYLVVRSKVGSTVYTDLPYHLLLNLEATNLQLVNTLILYNPSRFKAAHTTGSESGDLAMMSSLISDLTTLANHPTVNGVIIQLDQFGDGLKGTADDAYDVNLAYKNWDANPTNVAKANAVSAAIRAAMVKYMEMSGKKLVEPGYVVIIGDDDQIPFWRQQITAPNGTWRTETDYFTSLGDTVNSPIDAALFGDYTLTDNYYGNYTERGTSGEFSFLPGLAVGRLVDTPARIQTMVKAYLDQGGVVSLYGGKSAVAGYDFLEDTAQWSCNYLSSGGGLINTCTTGNFTNSTLLQQFITDGPNVAAFFGHASHYQFIASSSPKYLTAEDIQGATFPSNLNDILWLSIGCHSGLPVPKSENYSLSLVQALAEKKVTYIGNTGWAWGTRGSTAYSEIMYQLVEKRLRSNTLGIGEALRLAKQDYFFKVMLDSAAKGKFSYSGYDAKVMAETTLYGLPMLRFSFPGTPATQTQMITADPKTAPRVETIPLASGAATDNFRALTLKVSNLSTMQKDTTDGTYFTDVEGNLNTSPNSPILPQSEYFNFDTSLGRGRGVLWLGGKYTVVQNNNPLVTTPNDLTTAPDAESAFSGTYPIQPVAMADLERLDGTISNHLTFQTGQFFGTQNTGNLRLFSEMEFLVGLDKTLDTDPSVDLTQPEVGTPIVIGADTVNPSLTVCASDAGGIYRVYFTYTQLDTQAASGEWKSLEMTATTSALCPGNSQYILERDRIPVGNVTYFIQVMDNSGNVSSTTDNGQYYSLGVLNRYTISGNADIPGATINYTGGSTTSDANNLYSFPVYKGWTGIVTPSKIGYTFSPVSRSYTNVTSDQANQNFAATLNAFAISGNAGVANAVITYTGATYSGMAVTDADGNYVFTVPYNWTGTVTPSKVGFTFSPTSRSYANVLYDRPNQGYAGTQNTIVISGKVTGGANVAGVTITYTGGSTTTDQNGTYTFTVPYGWTGTVTPSQTGSHFSPANKSYFNVSSDQLNQDYAIVLNAYTISGNAEVGYATITYTGGSTTADGTGDYAFTVEHGWTGTVIPTKTGYTFTPGNKSYTNVISDQPNQNYIAASNTYAISGNVGIGYATITYSGGSTTADAAGNYAFTVNYDWTGTVTPTKTGYHFSPPIREYINNVISDQLAQNFTAALNPYTISGTVGIGNATVTYTGGSTVADGTGNYSFTVLHGWSGTVTPSLVGYHFTPGSKSYINVTSDLSNEDYTAVLNTYTISGNVGIGNATITYTGGSTIADSAGNYSFTVTHGWSGTATPSKVGYSFIPASRDYPSVISEQSNQNYTATTETFTISGNVGLAGVTISTGNATTTSDSNGHYSLLVHYGWTGTATPSRLGYTFTPARRDYGNVTSEQPNQNYTSLFVFPITISPGNVVPGTADNIHIRLPTFTWEAVPGATSYTIEAAIDPYCVNFATKILKGTVSTNSYTPSSDLAPNTVYCWRIRANGLNLSNAHSPVRTFTTGNSSSAPSLVSPRNKSLVTTQRPLFNWLDSSLPAGSKLKQYEFQIASTRSFTAVSTYFTTASNWTPTVNLTHATTYYWRVRTWNTVGDFSGWSAVWTVKIAYAAPNLISPANGSRIGSLKPLFSWTLVPGATSYKIQISAYANFSRTLVNATVTDTTYTPIGNLPAGKTLYWHVQALGAYGPSAWSAVWTIITP